MAETILKDKREIKSIQSSLIDSPEYCVGKFGVTKIEAYGEPGMHCDLPWVRIFKGEELVARISCYELAGIYYA